MSKVKESVLDSLAAAVGHWTSMGSRDAVKATLRNYLEYDGPCGVFEDAAKEIIGLIYGVPPITKWKRPDGTEYRRSPLVLFKARGWHQMLVGYVVEQGGTGLPEGERPFVWRSLSGKAYGKAEFSLDDVSGWASLPSLHMEDGAEQNVEALRAATQTVSLGGNSIRSLDYEYRAYRPSTSRMNFYTYGYSALESEALSRLGRDAVRASAVESGASTEQGSVTGDSLSMGTLTQAYIGSYADLYGSDIALGGTSTGEAESV